MAADHAAGPSTCEGDGSELDAEDEGFVDLGKGKRASVSDFKGKKFLNIREYYSKDGQWLPGGLPLVVPSGIDAFLGGDAWLPLCLRHGCLWWP